ncbi:MAG: hypothetical protein AAGI37_20190 [Planctomycetota bacterium]
MSYRSSSGQKLAIWIGSTAFFLLIAVGLGLKMSWDNRFVSLVQAKADFLEQFPDLWSDFHQHYEKVLKDIKGKQKTPDEISKILGGNVVHVVDSEFVHRFYDDDWPVGMMVIFEGEIDTALKTIVHTGVVKGGLVDSGDGSGGRYTYDMQALRDHLGPDVNRLPIESKFESLERILSLRVSPIGIPWVLGAWLVIIAALVLLKPYRPLVFSCSIWVLLLSMALILMSPSQFLSDHFTESSTLFVLGLYMMGTAIIMTPFAIGKKKDLSLCIACGYRLVGNTTGVCPECGEMIAESQREYLQQLT